MEDKTYFYTTPFSLVLIHIDPNQENIHDPDHT